MVRTLPRFIVLKTDKNGKYLRHIQKNKETRGFLQFSGEEVVSPHAKFEVELAEGEENDGLVHIKCCYNNKYWVCPENQQWIVADAHEKEEDHSKWSCTLFKPKFYDSETLRLRHVFHGRYANWCDAKAPHNDCLSAGEATPKFGDFLTYIDWESLSMLPKHIAFKGSNGCYLRSCNTDGRKYLEFNGNDIDDVTVGNQVFINHDGSIRIRSDDTGKFWRRSPNWIWPDSDDTTQCELDTCFWVTRVNDNTIALRNLGNNEYCKSFSTEGKSNCLHASADTIWKDTHMEVEEFVKKREIYNVRYHLLDARIYDQNIITMVTDSTFNDTAASQKPELELTYRKEETQTWNASVSLKVGLETSIKAGIPSIGEGEVKVSAELESKFEWGVTKSKSQEVKKKYAIEVMPMTTVKVSLVATKASYDVPYSYSQRDTLINGREVIYDMDDGLYTGSNAFNFECKIKSSPLPESDFKCDIRPGTSPLPERESKKTQLPDKKNDIRPGTSPLPEGDFECDIMPPESDFEWDIRPSPLPERESKKTQLPDKKNDIRPGTSPLPEGDFECDIMPPESDFEWDIRPSPLPERESKKTQLPDKKNASKKGRDSLIQL